MSINSYLYHEGRESPRRRPCRVAVGASGARSGQPGAPGLPGRLAVAQLPSRRFCRFRPVLQERHREPMRPTRRIAPVRYITTGSRDQVMPRMPRRHPLARQTGSPGSLNCSSPPNPSRLSPSSKQRSPTTLTTQAIYYKIIVIENSSADPTPPTARRSSRKPDSRDSAALTLPRRQPRRRQEPARQPCSRRDAEPLPRHRLNRRGTDRRHREASSAHACRPSVRLQARTGSTRAVPAPATASDPPGP